jgi:hypothetical protein
LSTRYEELYFETGVPIRTPYRKHFKGWTRAYRNAMWWGKPGNDVYIGVYGFKDLWYDGLARDYARQVMPDYTSVVIDKVFMDFDYYKTSHGETTFYPGIQQEALAYEAWLDEQNLRRRWIFSGGGYHVLVLAEGSPLKVENALLFVANGIRKEGISVDPTFDMERMRRMPGTYNRKRKAYCIPITPEELELPLEHIWTIAQEKRRASSKYAVGDDTWFIDNMDGAPARTKTVTLGRYSKRVEDAGFHDILDEYGLDWDEDFCKVMQGIIRGNGVSNFERMQILRYLKSVVKVPFVDVSDPDKTVMRLFYNLLVDKKKGKHSVKEDQAKSVYKRDRKFHPYKLKMMGYCPEDCKKCLERRTNGEL